MLDDSEIQKMVTERRSLDRVCRLLVQEANARGGLDNVTVLMIKVM